MSSSSPSSAPTIPDELAYLITAFLPSAALDSKSKAFLVLSSYCQGVRSSAKTPADATIQLSRIFSRSVIPAIGDTDEQVLLSGITFLTALFEVDWESASSIFQEEGVAQVVLDSVDLTPSPELALSVALLLSHVSARKSCRAILPSETVPWLQAQSGSSKPKALRVAASIALLKLSRGSAEDTATSSTGEPAASSFALSEPQLAQTMAELLVSDSGDMGLGDPVEALAYLSTNPKVKDYLSRHKAFLERLFTLAPRRKASSPSASTQYYGILVIVANIVSYRVRLSQEQQQMDKLKSMAKPMGGGKQEEEPLEEDGEVKSRCQRLVSAGVLEVFPAASSDNASSGVREMASKALLAIVEDSNNRGKVLQAGGAKVLITIIRQLIPASKAIQQTIQFEAVQALAKLAITASPVQVFGPNETALYDIIRPFSIMVQHSSSTLLQSFEGVMALTNLSSQSAEVASRIASSEGLLNKVELFLLEDHDLIRRASMELICNLIAGSDTVFERYSGQGGSSSKVQILLAMSDVEDIQTRLAASGALSTVTTIPNACHQILDLQKERHHALKIIAQLIDPSLDETLGPSHPGLIHRGVVVVRNMCAIQENGYLETFKQESKESKLIDALAKLVKEKAVDQGVLISAIEALTILLKI